MISKVSSWHNTANEFGPGWLLKRKMGISSFPVAHLSSSQHLALPSSILLLETHINETCSWSGMARASLPSLRKGHWEGPSLSHPTAWYHPTKATFWKGKCRKHLQVPILVGNKVWEAPAGLKASQTFPLTQSVCTCENCRSKTINNRKKF